jgi:fatty acid desaturase
MFFALWTGLIVSVTAALAGVLPLWAACLINAVTLYVLAHINHEAIHRNISGGNPRLRWMNEAIGQFGSIWFFLPFPAFKAVHLAHHGAPNDPATDGDMWVARKHPLAVAASCLTILAGYEVQLWRLAREGKLSRANLISIYGQRLLASSAVIAAFALGYGTEAFFLWVLPALIVMPFLAVFFAFIVHRPHDETDPYRSSNVILARGFLQPLVTAIFVFQNYHLVHHLNPRIPFYQYGEHFRARRAELERMNAPITTL